MSITDAEHAKLAEVIAAQGGGQLLFAEVLVWAQSVRTAGDLLDLLLRGLVRPSIVDGDLRFEAAGPVSAPQADELDVIVADVAPVIVGPLTADTITDAQIVELDRTLRAELQTMPATAWTAPLENGIRACAIALSGPPLGGEAEHDREWLAARVRCAEILNARAEVSR